MITLRFGIIKLEGKRTANLASNFSSIQLLRELRAGSAAWLHLLGYYAGNSPVTFHDSLAIAKTPEIVKHVEKFIMLQ